MARPSLEVADIFRAHGPAWRTANAGHVSLAQLKVMSAIERCRTAALGGHVAACQDCGHSHIAYNSCRNRHQEVRLVDRLQNKHHRLLDDLVFQAEDTERPLRAVRLRDIAPSGRPGAVAAPVYPGVQLWQVLLEVFSIGLPRHPVDPRSGIPLQRVLALSASGYKRPYDLPPGYTRNTPSSRRRLTRRFQPCGRAVASPDRGRRPGSLLSAGSTSCTSCRCRTGTDRSVRRACGDSAPSSPRGLQVAPRRRQAGPCRSRSATLPGDGRIPVTSPAAAAGEPGR